MKTLALCTVALALAVTPARAWTNYEVDQWQAREDAYLLEQRHQFEQQQLRWDYENEKLRQELEMNQMREELDELKADQEAEQYRRLQEED